MGGLFGDDDEDYWDSIMAELKFRISY
jgi:hypothetical protein